MTGGLAALIESAARTVQGVGQPDRTTERILDAAVIEAAGVGLNRITVEDVVRRAGVSRMTAYRRYPRRDELIEALVHRETQRFLAAVDAAITATPRADDRVAEAFIAAVTFARGHPMLRRAGQTDSALSAADTRSLLATGASFIADHIAAGRDTSATSSPHHVRWIADIFARLFVSYVSVPPSDPDLGDDAQLRRFAHEVLAPMVARATGTRPIS